MSLRFQYKAIPVARPLVPLRGRRARPRPLITITLIGPAGTIVRNALLDTGADDTVFSEDLATALGIDLSTCPLGTGAGIGMTGIKLRYAEVTLRIADNQERREWRTHVGFTASKLRHPLLGFAGFLEFFTATFWGDREELELAINSKYSGT